MPTLNAVGLVNFSKELTKLAIENGFFSFCSDTTIEDKAKDVSTFYKTLLETLNPDETE